MIRILTMTLIFTTLLFAPARAVVFDWATVGNPFNADDIHGTGYGGVDSAFRISKHEVTNAQYAQFLNSVDPNGVDSFSLYNSSMSSSARGGIDFDVAALGGSKYQVKTGRGNSPVVYVSFFDAMRFVNWLQNGQGIGSTETGVYTIGSGTNENRALGSTFFIPSEDEWYKAAYYDPNSSSYYDFPTGTDTESYSDDPNDLNTPDDTNVANFFKNDTTANGYDDGYAVTGTALFDNSMNYLTDVGAYSQSMSAYGTFDQGGNVKEWNEAISGTTRGLRGGSWAAGSGNLIASFSEIGSPSAENDLIGFRVAMTIPEPQSVLLAALGSGGLFLRRRQQANARAMLRVGIQNSWLLSR